MKGFLNDKPATFQFLILVLLWFLSFSFINILVTGVLILQHGFTADYELLAQKITSEAIDSNVLKALQIVASLGMFLLPAFIFSYMKGENAFAFLKLSFKPSFRLLILVLPIVVFAAPFIAATLELNQNFTFPPYFSGLEQYLKDAEAANESVLKKLLVMHTPVDFIINLVMVAVVPALGEEIFFRGCLQQVLTGLYRNVHIAVVMSAVVFSFIHFQFYGFLPRMILGIVFGYLLVWTGSLWYAVFAHFLHNGLQVTMLYLFQQKIIDFDIETASSVNPVLAFSATIALFYVLVIFRKKSGSIV